jgi:hypothetical protein
MKVAHASQIGAVGLDLEDGGKEMIDAPMLKQVRSLKAALPGQRSSCYLFIYRLKTLLKWPTLQESMYHLSSNTFAGWWMDFWSLLSNNSHFPLTVITLRLTNFANDP